MCLICGMSNCECEKERDHSKPGAMEFVKAFSDKSRAVEDGQAKSALIAKERQIDPYVNHLAWSTAGLNGSMLDGRNVEEQMEEQLSRMGKGGGRFGTSTMRLHTILGCQLRPRQWGPPVGDRSENVLLLGCYPAMFSRNIQAMASILDKLGGRYTLLPKELCCGTLCDTMPMAKRDKATREKWFARPERLIGANVRAAKRLGAKNIYLACLWCVYVIARHYDEADADVKHHYYPDLALDLIDKHQPRLGLKQRVAYYPGCQNSKWIYLGPRVFDINWLRYRDVLDRVEGLDIVQLPDYCCSTNPDAVLEAAQAEGVTTMVTPCATCRNQLELMRPQTKLTIRTVVEILADALQV